MKKINIRFKKSSNYVAPDIDLEENVSQDEQFCLSN